MYLTFLNPNSRWIHSAEALVRPSSVSYGGAKYGRGAQVCSARVSALVMSPSMSSSDRPASAIAFRHASLLKPPQLLSRVTPSQRRSIWDCPHPTMATLPRCSQMPIPSRFLIQLVSAISAPSCPLWSSRFPYTHVGYVPGQKFFFPSPCAQGEGRCAPCADAVVPGWGWG